jgi:hypothetical protein
MVEMVRNTPEWVIWLLFAFNAIIFLWLLIHTRELVLKRKPDSIMPNKNDFILRVALEKIFSIREYTSKDEKDKCQIIIDKKLEMLALTFQSKDLKDRKLFSEIKKLKKEGTGKLKEDIIREEFDRNKKELISAKKYFWLARNIAKAFGFNVKLRYSTYLS